MNIAYLLNNLNEKQRDAVTASKTNLLVLAGAGSGKTRVLVHRIAWLQSVEKYSPCSILAVTFTNKAAVEMRDRIAKLISTNKSIGIWVGTFHGLAYRLLRTHYIDANLPQNFQIIDSNDQLRLLKNLIKSMNLDEKKWLPQKAMWYINTQKDEGIYPRHIQDISNIFEKTWQRIYQNYQESCNRAGLVDFSELLIRVYELWRNKSSILRCYRRRFTNILIDEFQDINNIQYECIRLMVKGGNGKIMIVGDDDQSIYSWRGAQIKNIHRFLNDFPNVQTIRLEQNYRSTSSILNAANFLIQNNKERLGKRLWTNSIDREPISLYCALNELDEAHFVMNRIKNWKDNGGFLKQCAILYRNNAQSRVLEEVLLQNNVSYQIHGGIRFFERQEIKNVLSYLRLIVNRNDDAAFELVVNLPARGIGNSTLNIIRQVASDHRLTLWEASSKILKEKMLSKRSSYALQYFLKFIEKIERNIVSMPLYLKTKKVIKDSGLWMMYKNEGEKGRIRIENLEELVTATKQFSCNEKEKGSISIQEFLSHIVLEKNENKENLFQDAVQLMTVHSAKGLEFPQVFIVGMEEGMFPSQISLGTENLLEEERRLAYVGVTRAMQKLTLTYAKTRRLYGRKVYHYPSRFINELPEECIERVDLIVNK